MIDAQKTKEKFNYEPQSLAPTSNVPVWFKCDECGSERQYSYSYCLRKKEQAKSNGGKELCQKCSHSHRKGKVTTKKVEGQSYVQLPPEVDVQATMDQFGYNPMTLAPWSRQRIVVRCYETGKMFTPKRCGLNRNKSILETGHFISLGAWTAKRRKGIKASDETKQKQASSQQKRRKIEKQPKQSSNEPTVNPVNTNQGWRPNS